MSDGENMTFWGHLGVLRTVLLKILAVVLVLTIAYFFFMPWIFNHVIMAPCTSDFPMYRMLGFIKGDGEWLPNLADDDFHVTIINIELASQLLVHMSASFYSALVTAFPIIIYLLWQFVAPGLYEKEKRGARRAFLFGNIMFYLGMAMGYFVVFPLALRFLADYRLSDEIANTVSLTSYMDSFYMLVLMMGLVFEIPVLAWLLGRMGLLQRSFFNRYRKYAIAVLLVLSAFITPTSDLFTLAVVFVPLYLLWEGSAVLVKSEEVRVKSEEVRVKK